MKVTKEHKKQIRIGTRAIGDNPTHTYLFQKGAEWAIEKFGGIQWKLYNIDNLPPVESFQGLILFKSGHMEIATWIVRDEEPGYDWYWPSAYYARQEDITHWAEINLPNQ